MSETISEECYLNHKAKFNHETLGINDSHSEKIISIPVSSSITETSSFSSSNLELKTFDSNSNSFLVDTSFPSTNIMKLSLQRKELRKRKISRTLNLLQKLILHNESLKLQRPENNKI